MMAEVLLAYRCSYDDADRLVINRNIITTESHRDLAQRRNRSLIILMMRIIPGGALMGRGAWFLPIGHFHKSKQKKKTRKTKDK